MNQTPSEALFAFRDGGFARADTPQGGVLLVADSFLVSEGRALALDLHRERFVRDCTQSGVSSSAGSEFWDAAMGAIPPVELWFPRLELVDTPAGPRFQLRVRPAPPLGDTVTLATYRGPDPRSVPQRKGPDLDALLRIRRECGADEAVLLADGGQVVDGTTSAILWWRSNVLCVVPERRPRVDSVTSRIVRVLAAAIGDEVREEDARPEELSGCEIWVVNALHGIRAVSSWADAPGLGIDRDRLNLWRNRMRALVRPVH